jgi:TRAP-type uncharacterized transport system fused permease subunit
VSEAAATPARGGHGVSARRQQATNVISIVLCVFTLVEVNYPLLAPQSRVALFALFGLTLCFLNVPAHPKLAGIPAARWLDITLTLLALLCCGYIAIHTDPLFEGWWS